LSLNNQLTGSIPELTGLTNLQFFFVSNNQLTGSIPELTRLTNLTSFWVNNNQLTGNVPSVPSPNALVAGGSILCPNPLNQTSNPAWDAATGYTPWYAICAPGVPTLNSIAFGHEERHAYLHPVDRWRHSYRVRCKLPQQQVMPVTRQVERVRQSRFWG